jgi:hypothetical protein
MNATGRIGIRLRVDPRVLQGGLDELAAQVSQRVATLWQVAGDELRADGRPGQPSLGTISFSWRGPMADQVPAAERSAIEARLRRAMPARVPQRSGRLAGPRRGTPPLTAWTCRDVAFRPLFGSAVRWLRSLNVNAGTAQQLGADEKRFAAVLELPVEAVATIVEVQTRSAWTSLVADLMARAHSRFAGGFIYFYISNDERRDGLVALDPGSLKGVLPAFAGAPALQGQLEPGSRLVFAAVARPSALQLENSLPGSVAITLLPASPWIAVAEPGAGLSAIAFELYGIDLPELLAPNAPLPGLRIQPSLLRSGYRAQFDALMEKRLAEDIAWIERALFEKDASPDALVAMLRTWSQVHDVRRPDGTSWFDAFLDRLARDGWYRDYVVHRGATTSYLDTLLEQCEEQEAVLLGMLARSSERHGGYRPPEAILAQPQAGVAPIAASLVKRAADRVLGLLDEADGTPYPVRRDASRRTLALFAELPAAAQVAVLQEIMSRHGETTWIGLGRYGERRAYAMLYWVFERLVGDDARKLADRFVANGILEPATADALVEGRGVVAHLLPYTTDLAIESTEFWAKRAVHSSGAESGLYSVMGGLSVLATPHVVDQTALILGTAGLGAEFGPALALQAPRLATVLGLSGIALASFSAGAALGQLASGRDANGQPLDDNARLVLTLVAVSNILFAAAGVIGALGPKAPPGTALARVPPGSIAMGDAAAATTAAAPEGALLRNLTIRVVSFDPKTGEALAVAHDAVTGRYAMARINVRTGNGTIVGAQGEVGTIANFRLAPPRAALSAGAEPVVPTPGSTLTPPGAAVLDAPVAGALKGPVAAALPGGPQAPLALPGRPVPPALPAGPVRLALPLPRYNRLDEILPDPLRPFLVPSIEANYRAYAARQLPPSKAAARDEWVLLTRHGPRTELVNWLGPNFPTGEGEPVFIKLSGVARPPTLTDARLRELTAHMVADPPALTARYDPASAAGATPDDINLGNFNVLKGNVGELLARPVRTEIVARLQQRFPNARTYDGARITLAGDTSPKLFSDGVIAENSGRDLVIRGIVETKAGGGGGLQATEQVWEWTEGRIEDGARLTLPDGRSFVYDPEGVLRNPDGSPQPRVIFLQSAGRHLIAPAGAQQLGTDSGMQIAPGTQRYGLPATADEINYLTRLAAERLAAAATPATPTPTSTPPTASTP